MLTQRARLIRRVRDLLRASLMRGVFGDREIGRLSSESELMRQFGAPRDVVREALSALRQEGVIDRRQGVGTLVSGTGLQFPGALPGLGASLESHVRLGKFTADVIGWDIVRAPSVVASNLTGVNVDDDCLCIDYVALMDNRPFAATTNYVRNPELSELRRDEFITDFYSLLASSGVALKHHTMVLETFSGQSLDPALGDAFTETISTLRAAGAEIVDVSLPSYAEVTAAAVVTILAEAGAYHAPDIKSRWSDYFAFTRLGIGLSAFTTARLRASTAGSSRRTTRGRRTLRIG